jgi:enediyne biosynthesis protein E4
MGRIAAIVVLLLVLTQCRDRDKLFLIRHAADTGIDFQNTIITNDSTNALTFEYIYNGSGVGIGDFDRDGLEDIFFGGNNVSSELYLNKGKLQFEDITVAAGVSTNRWITGVSVVDINADGWPDIYLSVGGKTIPENRKNILFINKGLRNGIPFFEEQAKAFGLDDDSYSTMAAFFDYDKDGDDDMYLVNNWLEPFNRNNLRQKRTNGEAESTDKLYRNNGDNTFTDISRAAGILIEGYGLGINICDINEDSWPDIYVSNDFMSNDLLWINNQDGTFTNKIGDYLKHQTHNGMGIDIADFNNDALADIAVVDMLPPGHSRQKMMTPGQNYDHFHMSMTMDYQPQYMRNTLQLNRGKDEKGNVLFSEIAFLSGVAQTDWSWSPLFADFDNDGWKDLFIGNGYRKDVTNLDFIFFGFKNVTPFGTSETRRTITENEFKKIEDVKLANYFFRNTGGLKFQDNTKSWTDELPTFTNGAAYCDFDNDGDLDLITNNIDQEAILYENRTNLKSNVHYFRLINGDGRQSGEKIYLYAGGTAQFQECTPYRGFQSTVTNIIHFGIGNSKVIDSLVVEWPDGNRVKYKNLRADTLQIFRKKDASMMRNTQKRQTYPLQFETQNSMTWKHVDRSPSDIKVTRTLMHELGNYGPCYAKGDVNGDGLDDFYFGKESGETANIFIQQKDGSFRSLELETGTDREDGAALFFDADSDGDQDLYIAGACASGFTAASTHIIYSNDGQGNFSLSEDAVPSIHVSALTVEAADFDADGDLDLFIGGHLKAMEYPKSDRSYLLQNDGGRFQDVTTKLCTALQNPGLVTSAQWTDLNNDKLPDLIIAGEWMPIRVFINDKSSFTERTNEFGLADSNGWWQVLKAADINGDGLDDIIAGNTGTNSFFHPTEEHPLILSASDFDKNGSVDPILTYYNDVEKNRFVVHNRLVLIDQIPAIKRRIQTFSQYATTPFEGIFTQQELQGAYTVKANTLASVVLINQNGKSFTTVPLPDIAQISTLNDVIAGDLNADGKTDLILVGNNYNQETLFGRYDASVGTILLNDGHSGWSLADHAKTKFTAAGDVRHATTYHTPTGKAFLILQNNDSLITYRLSRNFAEATGALAKRK